MYRGLRKEVYVLCFGRLVTAMGSLIWPMLTLILKSKLGYDAVQVARWFLIFGLAQIPFNLLSGKLTDKYNKKKLILIFDLMSVSMYVLTAVLPLSITSICIYYLGSILQHMEIPAYDALIAEVTADHDREKAYSLHYLSNNLGVVFAPTLGGLLFENYLWLSFLIAGTAVLSSTILIFFLIPNKIKPTRNTNTYEQRASGNLFHILKARKILFFYMAICWVASMVYSQFNYLLPIQMDEIFHNQGAVYFGLLTSINGVVVIVFTPIFTKLTLKWHDLERYILGMILIIAGLSSYYFYGNELVCYVISMIVFTLGEVMYTLGNHPYISKRIPDSHRGRFNSINNTIVHVASSVGNAAVGRMILLYSFRESWILVFIVGIVLLGILSVYRRFDRKHFYLLYDKK